MADANVRIVVSAITEAAEQALDGIGDELTEVGVDAAAAQTGLDQVSDEMGESTRAAAILQAALDEMSDEMREATIAGQLLQNALDEVGDESLQAAAASSAASGSFGRMGVAAGGASASVGGLSTVFMLSLIPAIMTALTVIAPLVAVLGALTAGAVALAGAFGLIIGSGILAFGDEKARQNRKELEQTNRLISQYESLQDQTGSLNRQQQKRLDTLKERKKALEEETSTTGALAGVVKDLAAEIKPLVVEFGREFIPLIKEAVAAIPDIVDEMFAAVGGTETFKDALRDFGAAAATVLPAITGAMFELARNAMPLLREFFGFMMNEGGDAMEAMFESASELEPQFRDFLDAVIEVSPTLLEFGTNVGKVLIPALTELIRVADGFMETINDMDPAVRRVVIAGLLLLPVLVKLIGFVSTLAGLFGGGGAAAGLIGLLKTLATVLTTTTAGAVALGAGLGLIGVKALDAVGALEKVAQAGADAREALGGENADRLLAGANIASFGGLEALSKAGVTITDIARGESDWGADERRQVGQNFDRGEQQLGQDVRQIFSTTVNVDQRGNVTQNPFSFSRTVADQVNREKRSNSGT